MKKILGMVLPVAALIFTLIYFSQDDREKVIGGVDSSKIESLLFLDEDELGLAYKATVGQQGEDGTYYIGEDFKKGKNAVNIIYIFHDKYDIPISEGDIEANEEIEIMGQRGFYINLDSTMVELKSNENYEEIHFSLDGIYYKVGYYQKGNDLQPIGKEELISLVEKSLK